MKFFFIILNITLMSNKLLMKNNNINYIIAYTVDEYLKEIEKIEEVENIINKRDLKKMKELNKKKKINFSIDQNNIFSIKMIDKKSFFLNERVVDLNYPSYYLTKQNNKNFINKEIELTIEKKIKIDVNEGNKENQHLNKSFKLKTNQNFFKTINNTNYSFNKTFSSLQFNSTSFTIKAKENEIKNKSKINDNNNKINDNINKSNININNKNNNNMNTSNNINHKISNNNIEENNLNKTQPSFNNNLNHNNINIQNKNYLFNYLPLRSNSHNKQKSLFNYNNLKTEISEFELQYEMVKNDLLELNPALKKNPKLREQFFQNISEGNEEKYLFYQNLYELVNNINISIKPIQRKNIPRRYLMNNINKTIKNNPPVPGTTLYNKILIDMNSKKKYNQIHLYTDTSKLMNKTNSHFKRNNSFNY